LPQVMPLYQKHMSLRKVDEIRVSDGWQNILQSTQ